MPMEFTTAEMKKKATEMFPHNPDLAQKTYLWQAADNIDQLVAALHNARSLLRAFGGDNSGLTEQEAKENHVDMIQWAMFQQIDALLGHTKHSEAS